MKSKYIFCTLFNLFMLAYVFSEEVFVAPIVMVDDFGESYELDRKMLRDIVDVAENKKDFFGIELLSVSNDVKTVRSTYDALRVCKEESIDYLVYGWVRKSEFTYEGELRFFDGVGRKVVFTVYAKDSIDSYEKFVGNLCDKLLDKIREAFFIPDVKTIEKSTRLNVDTGLGSWVVMGKDWGKYLTGVISVNSGLEVIPDDNVFFINKSASYFSVGLSLDYLFGLSKSNVIKGFVNSVDISIYSNMYFNLYEVHRPFVSLGIIYCLDTLLYEDKYSSPKASVNGGFGVLIGYGYKYCIKEWLKIVLENDFEIIGYSKVLGKFRFNVGVEFEVFSKGFKK